MWPFKNKKKEAEEMWDILQGKPDPKAIEKMLEHIEAGNIDEVERIFKKHMQDKMREIERDIR